MELGPIQKEWVKSLRENPHRQTKGYLGMGTPEDYKACCLGEALATYCRMNNEPIPFHDGYITDNKFGSDLGSKSFLFSHEKIGLHTSSGKLIINKSSHISLRGYLTLASANDSGVITWEQIADYIETYPEVVFNKSV